MKISLVATGGTIGSRPVKGVMTISDAATEQIASILDADSVFGTFKIHSANVDIADLNMLRRTIESALATNPDGVIITHGTDTLAYSSTYLAYAFADTRIPIVMCAADNPLTADDSNGYVVLSAARSFLRSGKPGVYVLYRNPGEAVKLHHGARLIPAHMYENFYFSIGEGVAFKDTGLMKGMNFDLSDGRKVLCITPYVGIDYDAFDMTDYAAAVQVGYHSGSVNVAKLGAFASDHPDIPVYFTAGRKNYDPKLFPQNVVQCRGITQTALYIKLLVGLKNKVRDLTSFVMKNACGEIVSSAE